MMLRATVVDVDPRDPTRVWVTIPQKYGTEPVRVFTRVQVTKGDHVYVANTSVTRVPQWVVFGQQTEIGRWGNPYPHTHPIGQVDGLVDALGKKLDADAPTARADPGTVMRRDTAGRTNVGAPDSPAHATTKAYVDGEWSSAGVTLGSGWKAYANPAPSGFARDGIEYRRTGGAICYVLNLLPVSDNTSPSGTMGTLPPAARPSRTVRGMSMFDNSNGTQGFIAYEIAAANHFSRAGQISLLAGPPPAGMVRGIYLSMVIPA